ncbi:MAG: 5-formyltetrahydrofolate cyclo-ligase [Roseburia sp.]|nr:5-formyltetrahydrofolate cyclo-ligase [Roseburia sp.]
MESKEEIRRQILAVRGALPEEEIASKSGAILQKVLKTPEYEEADNILLYADCRSEVRTRELFEDAIRRRKKVYFPKADGLTNRMDFYQVTAISQLLSGYQGILEPRELPASRYRLNRREDTLIIVPGIAFDISGYRLGYGKGFYDRFLAERRQISTMALAYACQLVDELPHDAHDIRMDKLVTEEIIYSFLRI